MRKILAVVLILSLMSGCAITNPRSSKDAMRYTPDAMIKGERFEGNYQQLAKCWDERAEKATINARNATYLNIYSELNMAEILVKWSGENYAVLIEIFKIDDSSSYVDAFGVGAMGKAAIPKWLSVLKSCEPS